jgi:hypothetical protein
MGAGWAMGTTGPSTKIFSFPPWLVSGPPISLPLLVAAAQRKGVRCLPIDGNALFYNHLLADPFLRSCLDRLDRAAAVGESPARDQQSLLLRGLLRMRDRLLEERLRMEEILKGRRHADAHEFHGAINTQSLLLRLVSTAAQSAVARDHIELPVKARSLCELVRAALECPWPMIDDFCEGVLLPYVDGSEDVVGFSVHTQTHMYVAARLATHLRRHFPRIPLVIGGTFLTTYANRWEAFGSVFDVVDYVIVHDGEEAFPELVHQVVNGHDLGSVPNLVWREGGAVRANAVRFAGVEDFAPVPEFGEMDLDLYYTPEPVASIPIARGCFYDCAYCNYPAVGGNRFRVDPAESVAHKVETLQARHGMNSFFFSVAVLPPNLARRLSEVILQRGLDIRWASGARFERRFTPELCELMAESGCTRLDFGAESGDAEVLERMHKGLGIQDYEAALRHFGDCGINKHFYFIMDFPGETVDAFHQTVDFARRAAPGLCSFNFFPFSLAHGSPVHADPQRYGVRITTPSSEEDIPLQVEYADPARSPERTLAKREALDGLAKALRDDFESDGSTFNHRGYVPDFVLQLVLPNHGRIPCNGRPNGRRPSRLSEHVDIVDLGEARLEGTHPAHYRLLFHRRAGTLLIANDATLAYLFGRSPVGDRGVSTVAGRDDPTWREVFDLFDRTCLLEPAS